MELLGNTKFPFHVLLKILIPYSQDQIKQISRISRHVSFPTFRFLRSWDFKKYCFWMFLAFLIFFEVVMQSHCQKWGFLRVGDISNNLTKSGLGSQGVSRSISNKKSHLSGRIAHRLSSILHAQITMLTLQSVRGLYFYNFRVSEMFALCCWLS